jgi:hypothetical protein
MFYYERWRQASNGCCIDGRMGEEAIKRNDEVEVEAERLKHLYLSKGTVLHKRLLANAKHGLQLVTTQKKELHVQFASTFGSSYNWMQ